MSKAKRWTLIECPKCGSSHWTSYAKDGVLIRRCEGIHTDEYRNSCHHEWPASEDLVFEYTKRQVSKADLLPTSIIIDLP